MIERQKLMLEIVIALAANPEIFRQAMVAGIDYEAFLYFNALKLVNAYFETV